MNFDDDPFRAPATSLDPALDAAGSKPTSVTVFGVLQLIFGIYSVFGVAVTAVQLLIPIFTPNRQGFGPGTDLWAGNSAYVAFMWFNLILLTIFTVLQISSGALLLRGRAQGRKLALIVAIYSIINVIVSMVVGLLIVVPMMLKQMQTVGGAVPGGQNFEMFMYVTQLFQLIGLIYPICVIIFMKRKVVLDYFERQERQKAEGGFA